MFRFFYIDRDFVKLIRTIAPTIRQGAEMLLGPGDRTEIIYT